jgi:hypothetical protein
MLTMLLARGWTSVSRCIRGRRYISESARGGVVGAVFSAQGDWIVPLPGPAMMLAVGFTREFVRLMGKKGEPTRGDIAQPRSLRRANV